MRWTVVLAAFFRIVFWACFEKARQSEIENHAASSLAETLQILHRV
jgi:hypothetical protein